MLRLFVLLGIGLGALAPACGESNAPTEQVRSASAPLLVGSEEAILRASDESPPSFFGASVDIDADTALIGAYHATYSSQPLSGQAYVFVKKNGTWTEQAILRPSDGPEQYQYFGKSVSLDGDTALVGTGGDKAYVFVRSGGSWAQQAVLPTSPGAFESGFGRTVAVDGDTALIGTFLAEVDGVTHAGQVFVFSRESGSWTQQAILRAPSPASDDEFGYSVALDGDTAIATAPLKTVSGWQYAGQAYVFTRSGSSWSEQAALNYAQPFANEGFGSSVALQGDTAVVSAEGANYGGLTDAGEADVFVRNGGSWTRQAVLRASDAATYNRFGVAVGLSGNIIVVGARRKTHSGLPLAGGAYVFAESGGVWAQQTILSASDATAGAEFGNSVSIDGHTALVGAVRANGLAGEAYVYRLAAENGDACTSASECASGYCVDGVCCNSACGGGALDDCQACSVANGAAQNGSCGALRADVAATVTCRPAKNGCDQAETCVASSTACPTDQFAEDGTACDDGLVCIAGSSCEDGVCTGGAAIDCNDNDPCTSDSCVEPGGCVHEPIAGCSADAGPGDAAPDAADAAPEAGPEAGMDAAPEAEAGRDAGADAADAAPEADAAVEADAMSDAAPDVEAGSDAQADAQPDAEAGTPDAAPDAAADAAADAGTPPTTESSGCSCTLPGGKQRPVPWAALLLGLGMVTVLRRRRRSTPPRSTATRR